MTTNELTRKERDNELRVELPGYLSTQEQVQRLFASLPEDFGSTRLILFGRLATRYNTLACDEFVRQLKLRGAAEVLHYGLSEEIIKDLKTAARRRRYSGLRKGLEEELYFD